jgi:hypothetical protein
MASCMAEQQQQPICPQSTAHLTIGPCLIRIRMPCARKGQDAPSQPRAAGCLLLLSTSQSIE